MCVITSFIHLLSGLCPQHKNVHIKLNFGGNLVAARYKGIKYKCKKILNEHTVNNSWILIYELPRWRYHIFKLRLLIAMETRKTSHLCIFFVITTLTVNSYSMPALHFQKRHGRTDHGGEICVFLSNCFPCCPTVNLNMYPPNVYNNMDAVIMCCEWDPYPPCIV